MTISRLPLRPAALCLALLPGLWIGSSAADDGAGVTDMTADPRRPDGASFGLGLIASDSEYAGEGARTRIVPLLGYEGERLFFRGIGGGVHLWQSDGLSIDAIATARLDGWDAEDLGRSELAARGIERDLLEDRDLGVDVGASASFSGRGGRVEFEVRTDVSQGDAGSSAELSYSLPLPVRGALLVPAVSVTRWSGARGNYHYGTLDAEIARGVPRYRPGALTLPTLSLAYLRDVGAQWQLVAAAELRPLPDEVRDSPLVDADAEASASLFVGLSRRW